VVAAEVSGIVCAGRVAVTSPRHAATAKEFQQEEVFTEEARALTFDAWAWEGLIAAFVST